MIKPMLGYLRDKGIRILMDLGCGYGVLSFIIADFIGADYIAKLLIK
jgi:16S rRNA G1207 methylase RsmC